MGFIKKLIPAKNTVLSTLPYMLIDVICASLSSGIALLLRFDFRYTAVPQEYFFRLVKFLPIGIIVTIASFCVCKLYKSLWRYASINELLLVFAATISSSAVNFIISRIWFGRMPVSFYFVSWLLVFCTAAGTRFFCRFLKIMQDLKKKIDCSGSNTMIIGAGEAGRTIIREILSNDALNYNLCCILDDNKRKRDKLIEGIPVVGTCDDILSSVEKYDIEKIIFAIPTATSERRRDILHICNETNCEIKVVPGIYQLVNGTVNIKQLRSVSVEELLGRDPIKVNIDEIMSYVKGKTVLVTGGGGSIGSELCRQISSHNPSQLIIFDIYENNAYDIQQELKHNFPSLNLVTLIGSVRDEARINWVFEKYRPDIVYHAAAHKHVPLMEDSPNESIKNNVFGTYKTAMAADKYGVKRFVLISTDKAVNPTNIMGASKRICEMIVQSINRRSKTEFVAVRFGNVLGSNGSVIPLFKKQIQCGGPVTVTHPDIIRYFMTIPEAVSLVLQAGAYAKGGEIFIFDMGEPVKIADLARNLIKLSGYTPDVDIKIEYVGLRPGEKLYEELLLSEEGLQDTSNKMIHIGKPIEMDDSKFAAQLEELYTACNNNCDNIRELVTEIVSTYKPNRDNVDENKDEKVFSASLSSVKSDTAVTDGKRCTA